jgi:glycosyltransferase involved in cell wall biosynthesis
VHVLVVTCAHRGDDARIVHRQARSLLEAGHQVTLVAPRPPQDSVDADPAGLVRVDVPRAVGRRRLRAWSAVLAAVRSTVRSTVTNGEPVGLVLLHDPELVPLFARRRATVPVVWDVHEDYVASISDRGYIPSPLRRPVQWLVERLEAAAVRRCHLLLAEDAYAERLGEHPVVLNGTWVPESPVPFVESAAELPRVVYAGRISVARGAAEMVELGRRLAGRAQVEVIGDADAGVREMMVAADREGVIRWHGYLPNPVAIEQIHGALAGLSLLHDEPNYRHSRPTKLVEYLAHGVPVISTPLPLAAELVERSQGGTLTSFEAVVDDAVAIVEQWLADPEARRSAARAGHRYVRDHHGWQTEGQRFVAQLETWAAAS